MSKSRDQLVERVLLLLGILAAGQSASAEDQETVDNQVEPVLAEMSARRIVYVADYSEYDDEYFNAIAECVAANVAPDFGADFAAWERRRMDAEERLKIMTRRTGTGSLLKTSDELRPLPRGVWFDWSNL